MKLLQLFRTCLFATLLSCFASAQGEAPGQIQEFQRKQLQGLARMDGTWRGPAWILLPTGERQELTQTERIGPFLSGTVKIIEGRGHDAEGKVVFNALGVIAYDPEKKKIFIRSYAMGRIGDFPLTITNKGYQWEIQAGPAKIQYTATIQDGELHEVGDRIIPGQEPIRFFEMKLKRIGDTKWPEDGAVPLK